MTDNNSADATGSIRHDDVFGEYYVVNENYGVEGEAMTDHKAVDRIEEFSDAMKAKFGWNNCAHILGNPSRYSELVHAHVYYAYEGWKSALQLASRAATDTAEPVGTVMQKETRHGLSAKYIEGISELLLLPAGTRLYTRPATDTGMVMDAEPVVWLLYGKNGAYVVTCLEKRWAEDYTANGMDCRPVYAALSQQPASSGGKTWFPLSESMPKEKQRVFVSNDGGKSYALGALYDGKFIPCDDLTEVNACEETTFEHVSITHYAEIPANIASSGGE